MHLHIYWKYYSKVVPYRVFKDKIHYIIFCHTSSPYSVWKPNKTLWSAHHLLIRRSLICAKFYLVQYWLLKHSEYNIQALTRYHIKLILIYLCTKVNCPYNYFAKQYFVFSTLNIFSRVFQSRSVFFLICHRPLNGNMRKLNLTTFL